MIVDACLFNDEIDLVHFRLRALEREVDVFVVGESTTTFSGSPKSLRFSDVASGLADLRADVVHVTYELDPEADRWSNERSAKLQVLDAALKYLGSRPGSVMFFDVDEIPSCEQVEAASRISGPVSVPMNSYYRRGNWFVRYSRHLPTPIAVPSGASTEALPNGGMHQRLPAILPGEAADHFSYLGVSPGGLAVKYSSFSHDELDFAEASDPRLIGLADWMAVDHLGRTREEGLGLLDFVPPKQMTYRQLQLGDWREDWLAHSPPEGRLMERLAAAVLVDRVVNHHETALIDWIPENPRTFWVHLSATQQLRLLSGLTADMWARSLRGAKARVSG